MYLLNKYSQNDWREFTHGLILNVRANIKAKELIYVASLFSWARRFDIILISKLFDGHDMRWRGKYVKEQPWLSKCLIFVAY